MAVTIRTRPARSHLQYIFIGATMLAAVAAVLPIAAAIVTGGGSVSVARTAFASAPTGNYAVVSQPHEDFDIIAIVPPEGGDPVEVARIPHLPGFTSSGAVSPDGKRLAVVTVEGGSLARPEASLLVVDLETATTRRVATAIDPLQTPVWSSDGQYLAISRPLDEGKPQATIRFFRVKADGGGSNKLYDVQGALGAYAVGFEANGALIGVTINGTGSHATRDGQHVATLSTQITRDWRLSPDGKQIAFIEANLDAGLRYIARTVALDGGAQRSVEALTGGSTQQLGVAWNPASSQPTFGREPSAAARSTEVGNRENLSAPGFEVPLDYSPDGEALAVTRWSGTSFSDAGEGRLAIVTSQGTVEVAANARFLGWATR